MIRNRRSSRAEPGHPPRAVELDEAGAARADAPSTDDRRLEEIAAVLQSLAAGDFAARAPRGDRGDLIDSIAAGVDALGEQLARAHVELERAVQERTAVLESATEAVTRRTLYDDLTGLPNRALFTDRVREAQAGSERQRREFTILVVDFDDFREVNETIGPAGADRILVETAGRLSAGVRPGDTVARLAGDQFGVLLPDAGLADAERLAHRLATALQAVVTVDGRSVVPSVSIGVAASGSSGDRDVLRDANVALIAAKKTKGADFQVYRPELDASVHDRLELSADLRSALRRGELAIVYQPIVRARSHVAESVEALLRWQHPERGAVPPGDFIPLAEETGVINEIGAWVLETACRELAAWRRFHTSAEPLKLSVNVSTRQLQRPEFIGTVAEALHRTGTPPASLTLEITESALVEHLADAVEPLHRLRELGIRVSIDDFGTGYSSLNYLRRLPVDEVKIDRSFVEGIADRAQEWAFASAIVRLIKTLGLTTVAEGVETGGQLAHVMAIGCDLAQGYHFGRPGPLQDVEPLLQARAS